MATDVDVQFFSHLNGLNLGNNWGDLIRMLDSTLVTGIDFSQITAASIDEQGDVHITLYAAHNAMLFQVVELSGFTPVSLNQKYRIKGTPNNTQLILKPHNIITERVAAVFGSAKLPPLGYDIVFRDEGDVKRVYRAKNPTDQHPFIRIDETISDGANSYNSTYAKYAMVGLLEHMDHIDDYNNPNVLQLPFDPAKPSKNWEITGAGASVVRGWARWNVAASGSTHDIPADTNPIANGRREFTLLGDSDCFYLLSAQNLQPQFKNLKGCGLFKRGMNSGVVPNWFLMSTLIDNVAANETKPITYFNPLVYSEAGAKFIVPACNSANRIIASATANPVVDSYSSGGTDLNKFTANNVPALEIPFYDSDRYLRGSLQHVYYAGKAASVNNSTTPILADSSMYLWDRATTSTGTASGGFYFYLGDLE